MRFLLRNGRAWLFDLLPGLADDHQHVTHVRRLAFLLGDPEDRSPFRRGDFYNRFVCFDLENSLVLLDDITSLDEPFPDFAFGNALAQVGQ